MDSHPISG